MIIRSLFLAALSDGKAAEDCILVVPSEPSPAGRVLVRAGRPALAQFEWAPHPRFRPIPPGPAWSDLPGEDGST